MKRQIPEKTDDRRIVGIQYGIVTMMLLLLISCASPRVYNVAPFYVPSAGTEGTMAPPGPEPVTITLFRDNRNLEDRLVIGRVIEMDGRPSPVLPRQDPASRMVDRALAAFLTRSGFTLSNQNPSWDLRDETLSPSWGGIILGGTINEFFIEVDRSKPLRTYTTRVGLTIVLAGGPEKRVLHRVTVETVPMTRHPVFSEIRMEEELSLALSAALERAFADSELREILISLSQGRSR